MFYSAITHTHFRELIERKSSQITDSQALGKQMVQLHKLRIKNKRKVDTRASKGRKVLYSELGSVCERETNLFDVRLAPKTFKRVLLDLVVSIGRAI